MKKTKEEKAKLKEEKIVKKLRLCKPKKYLTKRIIKRKIQNSQNFINISEILDNGIMKLKDGFYSLMYKVSPIDLSLTNDNEQTIFYSTLAKLYRLPFTIKAYKFDEKINLNANKENYRKLIEEKVNDPIRSEILINNYNFIETIEEENMTSASSYYFALICKNKEALDKAKGDFEKVCSQIVPRLDIEIVDNKKWLIKILSNMYYSDANLDQIIYYDFVDLLAPMRIHVRPNYLKIDSKEVQMVSIKNYPLFIEGGFLDRIINLPNVKASVTIKDSIEQAKLLNVLNSSFKAVLADYNSSKNISDVNEMKNLMDNYKILIEQISSDDEKIKEVSVVLAITGTRKEREEILKEIKLNAELYQIKVDTPTLRQKDAWQGFELSDKGFSNYAMYLPTGTLASSFFFTENYHNDSTGFLFGEDSSYGLPSFVDQFVLSKSRTGHNMSVIGTTGSGKSYLLKHIIVNEFARGTKLFLFDIENELQKLTTRCGGEYIDLSSKSLINPLQVRYVSTDEDEDASILGRHLGFLENFFLTAFEDISEKELVVLLDIVEKFYKTRGITKKTTLDEFQRMDAKDYPIFSDLYAYLLEEQKNVKTKELEKIFVNIEVLLKRMVTGQDGNLYNGITTIDLSNEIVDNKKKSDKNNIRQNMLLVIDEFHYFIDEDNPTLLKYFGQMSRRLRKYNTGLIISTQNPSDLTSSAGVLRHATALFGNCQYQITGMLKDNDIEAIKKIYTNIPLTETQKTFLERCHQGQFLVNMTNKNRLRLNVFATPLELYYMGEIDEKTSI